MQIQSSLDILFTSPILLASFCDSSEFLGPFPDCITWEFVGLVRGRLFEEFSGLFPDRVSFFLSSSQVFSSCSATSCIFFLSFTPRSCLAMLYFLGGVLHRRTPGNCFGIFQILAGLASILHLTTKLLACAALSRSLRPLGIPPYLFAAVLDTQPCRHTYVRLQCYLVLWTSS